MIVTISMINLGEGILYRGIPLDSVQGKYEPFKSF
jgi:hypothetical protein